MSDNAHAAGNAAQLRMSLGDIDDEERRRRVRERIARLEEVADE